MPGKNKTKKKTNGKKKKTTNRKKKSKVYMPIGGFSKSTTVRLRWCRGITMDPGQNSYASYPLQINNLIQIEDQLAPASNVTPGNYSEWISRYRDWVVMGAKVTCRFVPQATEALQAAVQPAYLGIYTAKNKNELGDILANGVPNLFEQPRNNVARYTAGSTLNDGVQVTKKFSARKFFNLKYKHQLYSNDGVYGSYLDDKESPADQVPPVNVAYVIPYVANVAGNNPGPMHVLIMIDFIVRFSNLLENRAQ